MNADEIVKALRNDVLMLTMDGGDNAVLRAVKRHMTDAADLIESLQAQLAESQRREQAAVELIEQKMIFDAGMGREPCEICSNADKTPCEECNPKWRGPQEAGKEKQNEQI